jgi:hypothetical protein
VYLCTKPFNRKSKVMENIGNSMELPKAKWLIGGNFNNVESMEDYN